MVVSVMADTVVSVMADTVAGMEDQAQTLSEERRHFLVMHTPVIQLTAAQVPSRAVDMLQILPVDRVME